MSQKDLSINLTLLPGRRRMFAAAQLAAGDQIIIVCETSDAALCTGAVTSARLSFGTVATGDTATRKVLTEIPEDTAIFTLSEAQDGWYLQCDAGYLTSSETGNALYYSAELETGSRWRFVNDVFLYNPSAASTSGTYTYRNYYLECSALEAVYAP